MNTDSINDDRFVKNILYFIFFEGGRELTVHSQESRILREVLEFRGTDIGSSTSQAPEKILDEIPNGSFARHEDISSFTGSMRFLLAVVIEEGFIWWASIVFLILFSIFFDEIPPTLIISWKEASTHIPVGSSTKYFRNTTRELLSTIGDDESTVSVLRTRDPMGSIRTLDHRGELRIANSGHLPCRTDRSWSDPDLHDVGPCEDDLFGHLIGYDISCDDDVFRELSSYNLDHLEKLLDIAIRDIETDERKFLHQSCLLHRSELSEVLIPDTECVADGVRIVECLEELTILLDRIVFVKCCYQLVFRKGSCHRECPTGCHIRCHDRDSFPDLRWVVEGEFSFEDDILARGECRSFWTEEYIGIVELDIFIDTHRKRGWWISDQTSELYIFPK